MKVIIANFFFLTMLTHLFCQSIPFNTDQWEINAQAYLLDAYKGEQSIYLKNGRAWLKEVDFQNGIIEFDILMEERRSFSGVIFRIEQEGQHYEEIYLRSHLNGMPDAMQYTPVYNRNSAWQLYHDQGAGVNDGTIGWKMEPNGGYNTLFNYPYGRWFHLKLVVSGTRADLYLDNQEKPVLQIRELKRGLSKGSIGIRSGLGATHFANFSYQATDEIMLDELADSKAKEENIGIIPHWLISNSVKENDLVDNYQLNPAILQNQAWNRLEAEPTGLINISKLHPRNREKSTVLAKVLIQSDKTQVKRMDFGYSDRAYIFCNNQILYSGNNDYRSRDYRYLGTIGYFDAVYLPLNKGQNELIIAVAETFGGWGIQAKLADMEGISYRNN